MQMIFTINRKSLV